VESIPGPKVPAALSQRPINGHYSRTVRVAMPTVYQLYRLPGIPSCVFRSTQPFTLSGTGI